MPSTPFTRGYELRKLIEAAAPGDTIHLQQGGEYLGPFLIDKPLSLVGHGATTQLFGRGYPAVVIRSPGVRLAYLELSDTLDIVDGVSLLIEVATDPFLVHVETHGRVESMTSDHIIDLGDSLPKQQVLTVIEVEVTGPSVVKCAENSYRWLRVRPETLATAGKHLLHLHCDTTPLGADVLAIGNMEVITSSTKQNFYVTMRVVATPPAKLLAGPIQLLIGKDYRVRFTDSFLLGKLKFPTHPAAAAMAERQALIAKELGGNWVLLQPWKTASPTLVNGEPLVLGRRVMLRDGDVIRVGTLDLKVQPLNGTANWSTNTALVQLNSSSTTATSFKLTTTGGKEKVKLVATVPWIQLQPTEVEMKKGESKDIQVALAPGAASLAPSTYREPGAILVLSKNDTLSVAVSLEVKADVVIPHASGPLQFGTVLDWTKAAASVMLSNAGTKEWEADVKVDQEWLVCDTPRVRVPGGKEAVLKVRLNEKAEKLPHGTDQSATVTAEGGGTSLKIQVMLRAQLEGPKPSLASMVPDFKELDEWQQAAPATVIVRNDGPREWNAVVRGTVPWLDILGSTTLSVPPNGQKSFVVRLNDSLPVGKHAPSDAIVVEGDGKRLTIGTQVTLKAPSAILYLSTRQVDFGTFSDWRAALPERLTIKNQGGSEWVGTLRCRVPWLDLSPPPGEWRCAPKSEQTIELRINDQINGGFQSIPNALQWDGMGGTFGIEVRAQYEMKANIRPLNPMVNFGELMDGASVAPARLLLINEGNKDSTVVAQPNPALPWISVTPQMVNIPKGGTAEFEVRTTADLEKLAPGAYVEPQALLLIGEGLSQHVEVRLTVPPVMLVADQREVTLSFVEGASLSGIQQRIQISNAGRRHWTGQVKLRVPWLVVSPPTLGIPVGQQRSVEVSVSEEVRTLGTGEQLFGGVIAFEGTPLTLDVRIQAERAVKEVPEFDPLQLDFGEWEEGGVLPSDQWLHVRLKRAWEATISTQDDWFEPATRILKGQGGELVPLVVRLKEQAKSLREGVHWGELIVRVADRPFEVPVRIKKVELLPTFEVTPNLIEFELDASDRTSRTVQVQVANRTRKPFDIAIDLPEGWLSASPASIHCPSEGSTTFDLTLTPPGVGMLKEGEYPREIVLRTGKYRINHPLSIKVQPRIPWKIREPQTISFGNVKKDKWEDCAAQKITIENPSPMALHLTVRVEQGQDWLEEPSGLLHVGARSQRDLFVALRSNPSNLKLGPRNGRIILSGGGSQQAVTVHVQVDPMIIIRDGKPRLSIEPPTTISFPGKIRQEWGQIPSQQIQITNVGSASWVGRVDADEWLILMPTVINLQPGESMTLTARLRPPEVFGVAPSERVYDSPSAIRMIRNGEEEYKLHVRVGEGLTPPSTSSPGGTTTLLPTGVLSGEEPKPPPAPSSTLPWLEGGRKLPLPNDSIPVQVEPLRLDFGEISDWGAATPTTIHITNQGSTPLQGVAEAKELWLIAEPREIHCPVGESRTVQVSVKKPPGLFHRAGDHVSPQGVVLTFGEHRYPIHVTLIIKA